MGVVGLMMEYKNVKVFECSKDSEEVSEREAWKKIGAGLEVNLWAEVGLWCSVGNIGHWRSLAG